MPQTKTYTVQAPDGKTITLEGPADAPETEVIAQAQRLYQAQGMPQGLGPTKPTALPPVTPPATYMDFQSPFARFLSTAASGVTAIPEMLRHPIDTLEGMRVAPMQQFMKAFQPGSSAANPDAPGMVQRAGHLLASVTPIVGPAAAQMAEEAGQAGDVAGVAGAAAGFMAPEVLRLRAGLPRSAIRLNPTQEAAVRYAAQHEIPIRASTATGHPLAGGVEAGTQYLPSVGTRGMEANQTTAEALTARGRAIGRQVGGEASKEIAGTGVQRALNDRVGQLKTEADAAYSEARTVANRNVRTVQTGTQEVPDIRGVTSYGMKTVPVTQEIASPVDYRSIKQQLAPLVADIEKQIPQAQREASPGYTVLRQIINADDHVPLATAITDLSAVQRLGYNDIPAMRTRAQGIASAVAKPLREAVDQAASDAGALAALNRGRALAKQKFAVADILEPLAAKEPVRLVDSLTAQGDKSIQALREIQRTVPQSMTDIGRSTLEGILAQATNEGGFKGARALADWNRLGRETRNLLYGAEHAGELDHFFQLGKMTAKDFNPSGSGKVAAMTALGTLAIVDPVKGVPVILSLPVVSRLLYNRHWAPMVVRALDTPRTSPRAINAARALIALGNRVQSNPDPNGGRR